MLEFLTTLLMFFLISVIVISLGLLIAICVITVKIFKMFLDDVENESKA